MPVDQLLLESDEAAHALAIGRSTFYALDSCVVATRLEAVRFACNPATLLDLHLVRVPLPSWSLDVRSSRAPALRCPAPCPGPPHCSGCAGADSDALHLGHARAVAAARRAGALGQRSGVSAAGDGPAPAGRVASPPPRQGYHRRRARAPDSLGFSSRSCTMDRVRAAPTPSLPRDAGRAGLTDCPSVPWAISRRFDGVGERAMLLGPPSESHRVDGAPTLRLSSCEPSLASFRARIEG